MNVRPSVLCSVDCSDASLLALRYATAIAEQFVTRLIVLFVQPADDRHTDAESDREREEQRLAAFVERAFDAEMVAPMCEFDIAYGAPSTETLRVARERSCDLIVVGAGEYAPCEGDAAEGQVMAAMSPQPVLLVPDTGSRHISLDDIRRHVRQVVAPGERFGDFVHAVARQRVL